MNSLLVTIDQNDSCDSEPDRVQTKNTRITLDCGLLVKGRDCVHYATDAPSDNGAISSLTHSHQLSTPMIIFMVHVVVDQTRLRDLLAFELFELFSAPYKIGSPFQTEVQVVSSEDVVGVEGLDLIKRNGEILQSNIGL